MLVASCSVKSINGSLSKAITCSNQVYLKQLILLEPDGWLEINCKSHRISLEFLSVKCLEAKFAMIEIAELNIHPVKSAAINPLREATIGAYGLLGDRMFMVVDAQGTLVSQRNPGKEHLALIQTELSETQLTLNAPTMSPCRVDLIAGDLSRRQVKVHDSLCQAFDCGADVSAWLTAFLGEQNGQPVSLVRFDTGFHRALNPDWVADQRHGTAFADGYPILVTSRESLRELNQRIVENGAQPIPMSRFRPNIVLEGLSEAFLEDRVKTLQLNDGAVELEFVKPCDRCPVTTIDQDAGALGADRVEPLRTLAQFRRGAYLLDAFPALPDSKYGKVMFGMNAIIKRGRDQVLRIGDKVRALYNTAS